MPSQHGHRAAGSPSPRRSCSRLTVLPTARTPSLPSDEESRPVPSHPLFVCWNRHRSDGRPGLGNSEETALR